MEGWRGGGVCGCMGVWMDGWSMNRGMEGKVEGWIKEPKTPLSQVSFSVFLSTASRGRECSLKSKLRSGLPRTQGVTTFQQNSNLCSALHDPI